MGAVWQAEFRFECMMEVEKAVAKIQAQMGLIPRKASQDIQKKARFSVKRIQEIEAVTRHDVIAFVSNVAEEVGPSGRYIHYGLTSSDVLDTALSLQVRKASEILLKSLRRLKDSLLKQSLKHGQTLCAGRTHGMHAEPTSFGLKMAGFFKELERNESRFLKALDNIQIIKLSGAVGTYSTQSEQVEAKVGQLLKLKPEDIATQVIPRDRHAELLWALAMIGGGLERLAVELRHLQRTEVGEVIEGFAKGQKGSSAMPHKKNPISSENITGLARLLRSYSSAAMENIALWHERDISHSSVERVIFPDAFILCDYALDRMSQVIDNLSVQKERMKQNMELSQGQLFSSHVLLVLVEKGLSREEAYAHVQRVSHQLKSEESLQEALLNDAQLSELLTPKDLRPIFSGETHKKAIKKVLNRCHTKKAHTKKENSSTKAKRKKST